MLEIIILRKPWLCRGFSRDNKRPKTPRYLLYHAQLPNVTTSRYNAGMEMKNFPLTAAIFEASLIPAALVLGWLLGTPPLRTFGVANYAWLIAILKGVIATLPLLVFFWLTLQCPWRPFREINEIIEKTLLPLFRECRFGELVVITAIAGLGEEMLFRGVVQAAISEEIGGPHGIWLGLLIASALFGMMHSITPLYTVLASLISLYLGAVWLYTENLIVPITAHALYDFLVLMYLMNRKSATQP